MKSEWCWCPWELVERSPKPTICAIGALWIARGVLAIHWYHMRGVSQNLGWIQSHSQDTKGAGVHGGAGWHQGKSWEVFRLFWNQTLPRHVQPPSPCCAKTGIRHVAPHGWSEFSPNNMIACEDIVGITLVVFAHLGLPSSNIMLHSTGWTSSSSNSMSLQHIVCCPCWNGIRWDIFWLETKHPN